MRSPGRRNPTGGREVQRVPAGVALLVPESQGMGVCMDVYNAFSRLVCSDVSPFLMSTAREIDTMDRVLGIRELQRRGEGPPGHPAVASTP